MPVYLPPVTSEVSPFGSPNIISFDINGYEFVFQYPNPYVFFFKLALQYLLPMLFKETHIALQKGEIDAYWSPIFSQVSKTFAYPVGKHGFEAMSSEDVQYQFRRHPELANLVPIFQETADCIITGPFGFEKSGPGICQRIVNQYVANVSRMDWTVQMALNVWEGVVVSANCAQPFQQATLPTDPLQRKLAIALSIPDILRKLSAGEQLNDIEHHLYSDPYLRSVLNATMWQVNHPSNVLVIPQVEPRPPQMLEIPRVFDYEPGHVEQAQDIIGRYVSGQRITATDLAWFQDPRNWDVIWAITHGGIDLGPLPDGVSCPFPAQPYPPPKPQPPSPPPQPQPQPPCPVACQCADLQLQHQLDHYGEVQNTLVIPSLQSQQQQITQGQQHDQEQDRQVLEIAQQIAPIKFEADQTRQDLRDLYDGLPNIITRKVNDFYEAVIKTPLLSALDCCFNKALKKVENAKQDLCQFGRDAWGTMSECWLADNTDEPGDIGDGLGWLGGMGDLVATAKAAAAEQSSGRWAEGVELALVVARGGLQDGVGFGSLPGAEGLSGSPTIFAEVV